MFTASSSPPWYAELRHREAQPFNEAVEHSLGCCLGLSPHERDYSDVSSDLDNLAEVQAVGRGVDAQFARLKWLARLIAGDAPIVTDVGVQWRVNMCVESPGHIAEAASELHYAGFDLASTWKILETFRDLVPGGIVLFDSRIALRGEGLMPKDVRIQGGDLVVAMEHVDSELAGALGRNGCIVDVDFLLSQHNERS